MSFLACLATKDNLVQIVEFLTAPEIDGSFVRPLSERPESILARVRSRYEEGFWVISKDKTTDGLAGVRAGIYHPEDEVVMFSTLAVHPLYRGNGIALQICDFSMDYAGRHYKPKKFAFDSWHTNDLTNRLAKRYGFEKVSEYVDPAKRPDGVRTVVYEKILDPLS